MKPPSPTSQEFSGKNSKGQTVKVRQTAWGNWYGYLGNRKVAAFDGAGCGAGGAEGEAKAWLEQMKLQHFS